MRRLIWALVALSACSRAPDSSAPEGDGGAPIDGGADADDSSDPPEDVIGDAGMAPFVDVTQSAGLPTAGGMCLAFDDFDGDGRADVLLGTSTPPSTLVLYTNDGNGAFHAHSLPGIAFTTKNTTLGGCAVGDVDADGKLDVVVASFFGIEAHYLHNKGNGDFEDAQTLLPAVPDALAIIGAAFADFDGDGWLDLLLAPYGMSAPVDPSTCARTPDGFACTVPGLRCKPPPIVYKNLAGASFASAVSITNAADCGPGNVNTIAITDWNGDGIPDVFAGNDWGTNRFYVSQAAMKYADVWPSFAAKTYNHAMGAAFEDFDRDGHYDLYVADLGSDQFYLGSASSIAAHGVDWGVAAPTRLHSGWAAAAEDFDSNGTTDVFIANAAFVSTYADLATAGGGGQLQVREQYDLLLQGQAGGGFAPAWMRQPQLGEPRASLGVSAVADYDGDGRLDVARAVGFPMRFALLHNVSPQTHWVDVRLKGHAPNIDGIGATVTLSVAGKPAWKRYVQRARGTIGGSSATLHFGLGASSAIDRIDVRWLDGTTQTVSAPGVDAVQTIAQP
jgi:hypothetical protein